MSIPYIVLSLLLALLPSVFWLALYLWEDRREPEPRRLLFHLFLAGMMTACLSVLLQEPIRAAGTIGPVQVMLIALIEKGTMLIAALIVAWRTRSFTQVIDGVMYMVAVALGFAFVENFFFFAYWVPQHVGEALGSTLARVSMTRFLLTTFVHTLTAGICGLTLGVARFRTASGWLLIVGGLAVAVALHAAFDAAVLTGYLAEAAVTTAVLGLSFLVLLQLRSFSRPRSRP